MAARAGGRICPRLSDGCTRRTPRCPGHCHQPQESKRQRLAELGFEAVLDSAAPDLVGQILEITNGHGVDVAIDDIGDSQLFDATLGGLADRGVVVTSGAFAGGQVRVDLRRLYGRSQRIIGLRTATPASVAGLWDDVAAGFRPVLDRSFPLTEAAAAHRYVAADRNVGRVALTVASAPKGTST
jgi:NADPH:quinone reductase-like Zn-dependent oxidoreductase